MKSISDEMFESFKKNLESVNGACVRTSKAELANVVTQLFKEHEIESISLFESPMLKEAGVASTLQQNGITVHTDHIRLHAETDKGGLSEAQHGIAELGTIE